MIRLGFIGLANKTYFDKPLAEEKYNSTMKFLRSICEEWNVKLVASDHLITERSGLEKVKETLRKEDADIVLILLTNFSSGELASDLGQYLKLSNTPVVIWGVPEPLGGKLKANSLCCEIFFANIFHSLNIPFKWVFGSPEEKSVQDQLHVSIKAINAIKKLRSARIAVIGCARPPGFYGSNFDEMSLISRFGVSIQTIEIANVLNLAEQAPSSELKKILNKIKRSCVSNLSDNEQSKALRIYWALRKIVEENKYDGLAIKCWPEIPDQYNVSVCLPVALLSDLGIPTSCEADVLGLISMLLSRYATSNKETPTLLDAILFDEKRNTIGFWHCGAAPLSMKRKETECYVSTHFNRGKPAVCEELLELGPVTILRLVGTHGDKMLLTEGRIINTPTAFKGSYGEVEVTKEIKVKDLLNTIIVHGSEHHFSITPSHHADVINEIAYWLRIKQLKIIPYERAKNAYAQFS